ncbi:zinc-binding dehydrogenase [Synechococcales cyanobacterium C]|uniref:Zinc-binding dehydrogenase n=1 Tax=Petrachloros mirabilis ULC683 TaxID=2781853 RepID=A0A8K1ZWI5_9CYAN|nr:zinc-dependent alcohol dehydrogenase family protein [Petrachloros mirabilis]NCJ06183.1 zinc-binding dehydrogenase [Petrachloros mirabilis ULC683]
MNAIIFEKPGSPEVLRWQSWPQPQIQQESEVLVDLRAAGVNPIDAKLRQRGTFYPEQMPAVLGCDGAGVVTAVGAAVQSLQPGDEVYFCQGGLGQEPGTYAEYAVVDARFVARKPKSLSFAEAAAAPLVLITAWEALYDRGRLQPDQTVLVQAGAGGVGHVAIQLAKLRGARVCTTVSSEDQALLATQLGADLAIRYDQTDPVTAIAAWTQNLGVDVAFDTVGKRVLSQCLAATRIYGDVVTLLAADAATDWSTARTRNLRVSFELMLTPMLQGLVEARLHHAKILRQCAQWLDAGQIKIHLAQTFPLSEAAAAHRWLETKGRLGKVALTP